MMRMTNIFNDKEKTLLYARIDCECENGMLISFDDDFTDVYEEYVLGIDAKEFSSKMSYLNSDVKNKFRAHN